MTFTQINFQANQLPTVWERHYTLPNGKVGAITHLKEDGCYPYNVAIHTQAPDVTGAEDWWASVVKDCGGVDTIEQAEALLLEAGSEV